MQCSTHYWVAKFALIFSLPTNNINLTYWPTNLNAIWLVEHNSVNTGRCLWWNWTYLLFCHRLTMIDLFWDLAPLSRSRSRSRFRSFLYLHIHKILLIQNPPLFLHSACTLQFTRNLHTQMCTYSMQPSTMYMYLHLWVPQFCSFVCVYTILLII